MANELTTDIQFKAEFEPSEITISNEDQLKELVEKTTNYYSSLQFSDENVDEAKKARADLNKVAAILEEQRKSVKTEYSKPLKAFEAKMKDYSNQIKEVSNSINASIKSFEDAEKEKRAKVLNETLEEMYPNYGIEPEEFEINTKWLNKTAFTKSSQLTKKTLDEVAESMTLISKEKKRLAGDKAIITNYAKAVGLDPESWVYLIGHGSAAPEIMREIDKVIADKKAQREHDEAIAKLNQQEVGGKVIDTETGEVIEEMPKDGKKIVAKLELTGTREQLSILNKYIVQLGIEVRVMKDASENRQF